MSNVLDFASAARRRALKFEEQRAFTLDIGDVDGAFPNSPGDAMPLRVALKAHHLLLFRYIVDGQQPEDPAAAVWYLVNALIRLRVRGATAPHFLEDASVMKIAWYSPGMSTYVQARGWRWLCAEIARARAERGAGRESEWDLEPMRFTAWDEVSSTTC